jgi:transcriptional regulator with XRE-family HTH domain
MTAFNSAVHHYTECGLDNVWIEGIQTVTDDDGDEVLSIPRINDLHHVIAEGIIGRDGAMDGKELRFLRTEMGLTQAELGQILQKEALTIGRWERGENPIDPNAETIIRLIAKERLAIKLDLPTEELSRFSLPAATPRPITIDGHDPNAYKLKPAA